MPHLLPCVKQLLGYGKWKLQSLISRQQLLSYLLSLQHHPRYIKEFIFSHNLGPEATYFLKPKSSIQPEAHWAREEREIQPLCLPLVEAPSAEHLPRPTLLIVWMAR